MSIVKTDRLSLRKIDTDDAEFMLRLLNDPDFIQYVGDKKARDLESVKPISLKVRSRATTVLDSGFIWSS